MFYRKIESWDVMLNISVVLFSLLLGVFGTWTIQNYGYKLGIVDISNERSSHNGIVPRGGGIGILMAFVFCSVFIGLYKFFWVPAVLLSLVSFAGDRLEIKPEIRLIIHFFCGFVFLMGLFYFTNVHLTKYLLVLPIAVYITGTSNFYNFMDGINGIAGITGVVGFLLLAAYGYGSGVDSKYIVLAISMTCACAGFLPFNIPKAKVFMGDVGSVLLGFVFACMVIVISKDFSVFICTAAFLFPFYADELTTMVVRIQAGDNLMHPHRKHIYQLLANEYGIAHWKVAVGYGISQLFVGISVIIIKPYGIVALISVLVLYFYVCIKFSIYVRTKNRMSKI